MTETPKAAQAFYEYCLLEDRSLAKLAATWKLSNGKAAANLRQLQTWSSQHMWQQRVALYDKEQAEKRRKLKEDALVKMNDEHALLGRTQALRAVKQIQDLIEAKKFGSQAAVQLLKISTDLERVSRGAATEISQVEHSGEITGPENTIHINVRNLTNKQLERLEQILDEAAEEGGEEEEKQ